MPDDTILEKTVNPGDKFAADEVGGKKYLRGKLALGADGVFDGDVSDSNPMPAKLKQGGSDLSSANPLPVEIIVSAAEISAANPLPVAGDVASGLPDAGTAPVKGGGVASVTEPPAVDSGDRVNFYCDDHGRMVILIDTASTIDLSSIPARSKTVDSISAAFATDALMDGLTAVAPKFAISELAADGEILAAVGGKKLRVIAMLICADATTGWRIRDGGGGAIIATGFISANGCSGFQFSPVGHFESSSGNNLFLDQTGSDNFRITLVYIEVDP